MIKINQDEEEGGFKKSLFPLTNIGKKKKKSLIQINFRIKDKYAESKVRLGFFAPLMAEFEEH